MDAADFHPDPIAQFHRWLDEAVAAGVEMPEAMTLATADAAGRPSARTVLLKSAAEDGFRFFTNTESRKGRELAENPQRRARLSLAAGAAAPGDGRRARRARSRRDEAEEYFSTRPIGSRLGAWASRQTEVIPGRETLDQAFAEAEAEYGDDPPLPPWWGGYLLTPTRLEFWQNRPNRLHDRFRYVREGDSWRLERLAP